MVSCSHLSQDACESLARLKLALDDGVALRAILLKGWVQLVINGTRIHRRDPVGKNHCVLHGNGGALSIRRRQLCEMEHVSSVLSLYVTASEH